MFSDCKHAPRNAESDPADQGGMPYAIAVISDGSALAYPDPTHRAESIELVLRQWAALIHEHTGLATRPVYVATQDVEDLSTRLRGLPPDIGAVVVIRTDPAHYPVSNSSAPGGGSERPVVTDSAMTAVAVTAALLTTLNRRGLSPERSPVVIVGAARTPLLRPLLLAAGFECVTSWDRRDAITFPLCCITSNAEAVIDLLGCTRELATATSDHPELIIITPEETSWALFALPGLLDAVATAHDPRLSVEDYHACALALAAATPPDRLLPDPMEPPLTSTIEQTQATAAAGSSMMTRQSRVQVGRVYEERNLEDGLRVLVDRLWPRGLTKNQADLDEWCKQIAPSAVLRTWYGHDPDRFEEFGRRYRGELGDPGRAEALQHLRELAQHQTLTLLTATRHVEISAAVVLADLLSTVNEAGG